jgi:hypothetical protein
MDLKFKTGAAQTEYSKVCNLLKTVQVPSMAAPKATENPLKDIDATINNLHDFFHLVGSSNV